MASKKEYMNFWLDQLARYWELAGGRYQILTVESEADHRACMEVLDTVRRLELNRVAGSSVLESHAFAGEQLPFRLTGCRDTKTGQMIGCLRITAAREAYKVQASREEYMLDGIPEVFRNQLSIFTRLAVLKPYRKSPAALLLMAESTLSVLHEGGLGAVLTCEPNLYTMYRRLGLRPIGALHNSPSGGYRLPLIFIPDLPYLESIKSPAVRWKKGLDLSRYDAVCAWYHRFMQAGSARQIGLSDYLPEEDADHRYEILTEGMSEKGRKAFLQNALVVHCHAGDVVLAEQDGSNSLGIILKGKAEVVAHGKKLATMEEGQVFGEMALVLNTRRTASIVAAEEDTEIMLCSPSAYQRLEKDADKACFWQNLAKVLAQRVLEGR